MLTSLLSSRAHAVEDPVSMKTSHNHVAQSISTVFSSKMGWMGLLWHGELVKWLVFGHPSRPSAVRALQLSQAADVSLAPENNRLVARLQQFAGGVPDDFLDVQVDWSGRTPFQRTVLHCCREIPYGEVASYGELARRAGSPQSARAVGNVMARNRIPLIIPCHRVVASRGALGGFSAPGGLSMKKRLLQLENAATHCRYHTR